MDSSVASKAAEPTGSHPSGDRRFHLLDVAIRRHQHRPDALIEILHTAQSLFGCLEHDVLYFVAHRLKLPPSRVYGVATFYHFFTLTPAGRHTCVVCTGTACYVNGAARLLAAVEGAAGIRPGETTADRNLTLLTARCLGTCGLAPVVVIDGRIEGPMLAENLANRVKGSLGGGTQPTC